MNTGRLLGIPYILLLLTGFVAAAETPFGELESPVIIVADATTGQILFERNPDLSLPPASLAKLMTLHLSMKAANEGRLDYMTAYEIPEGGRAADMRPKSSILGFSDGDRATLQTLQRAAAVASANDAAWSLALLASDSSDEFIAEMNRQASLFGMHETVYTDPDGWSEQSRTTGADQLKMVLAYLDLHPEALERLHQLPAMEYAAADQLGSEPEKKNTNLLIGRYQGVDGLKTGTIPSAGYHFIATAERKGSRFIALVMGLEAEYFRDGLVQRAEETAALLDWAFNQYATWRVPEFPGAEIPLRHGESDGVSIISAGYPPQTLKSSDVARINRDIDIPESMTAPLDAGMPVGSIRWVLDGVPIAEEILIVEEEVRRRWRLRDFLNIR